MPIRRCDTCGKRLERRRIRGAMLAVCPECSARRRLHSDVTIRCTKCGNKMRSMNLDGVSVHICLDCIRGKPPEDGKPEDVSEKQKPRSVRVAPAVHRTPPAPSPVPRIPAPPRRDVKTKKLTLKERIHRPHILTEMMQCAGHLSARAQTDYLTVLEHIVGELRLQVERGDLIRKVEINHKRLWSWCKGRTVAFIDGGVANMGSLGAAPVAIRVGSYLVRPGSNDSDRERFNFEVQMVEELYESTRTDSGFYEDLVEDVDKLREVARIVLEASGAIRLVQRESPEFLFMHGALVNPVSMYAFRGFPNFSRRGLDLLLPEGQRDRTGNDANFVRVHLKQLELLAASKGVVCGVVERASVSHIASFALLDHLRVAGGITEQDSTIMRDRMIDYKINDAILFECLLEEGEYLKPLEIDRNVVRPGRVPEEWIPDLREYPKPAVSYIKPSDYSLPLRVEMFGKDQTNGHAFDLLIHCCRLLPKYAFPAGLDIVDKHAKIPNWMTRPINAYLAAQIMRKAIDTQNPLLVNEVRRMLCGTGRDWLFRPSFEAM